MGYLDSIKSVKEIGYKKAELIICEMICVPRTLSKFSGLATVQTLESAIPILNII
jgi:hypothetical protein